MGGAGTSGSGRGAGAEPLRCDARTSSPDQGFRDALEEGQAVLAAGEGVRVVLGVGHHAEDAEVGGEDAGDVADGAVAVAVGVTEGDEALALQPVQRRVIGEVVAVAMGHRGAEGFALLPARGVGGAGAFDAEGAIHGEEAEAGVAEEGAGKEAGLGEDLEAVADAEDVAALGREVLDGLHDGGLGGHGAAAEVVPMGEAAGEDDEVEARGEGVLAVPEHQGLVARGAPEGEGHVALAVGAGEDDDGGLHGGCLSVEVSSARASGSAGRPSGRW